MVELKLNPDSVITGPEGRPRCLCCFSGSRSFRLRPIKRGHYSLQVVCVTSDMCTHISLCGLFVFVVFWGHFWAAPFATSSHCLFLKTFKIRNKANPDQAFMACDSIHLVCPMTPLGGPIGASLGTAASSQRGLRARLLDSIFRDLLATERREIYVSL